MSKYVIAKNKLLLIALKTIFILCYIVNKSQILSNETKTRKCIEKSGFRRREKSYQTVLKNK